MLLPISPVWYVCDGYGFTASELVPKAGNCFSSLVLVLSFGEPNPTGSLLAIPLKAGSAGGQVSRFQQLFDHFLGSAGRGRWTWRDVKWKSAVFFVVMSRDVQDQLKPQAAKQSAV